MRSSYLNNIIYTLIYAAPATLIAIVLHEYAHAVVSYLCGDKNVKSSGRLSLNPFKHLDPLGTLCLLIFHMGWAKPVMVNTASYKHKKLDFCLVALAGPLMDGNKVILKVKDIQDQEVFRDIFIIFFTIFR